MDYWRFLLVLLAFVVLEVIEAKDYYEILGVSRDATDRQIKKAFHKLATKYHPDKNKEKGAEDQFREIAQAYEILSDSEKRKQYDQFGDAAFNGGTNGRPHHFNNFNFNDFFKHFDRDFDDDFGGGAHFGNERNGFKFSFGGGGGDGGMFDDFFGGGGGGGDDAWSEFDSFGSQDTFFGHFGHHHNSHSHSSHSGNSEGGVYKSSESRSHSEGGRTCKTVTQRVGNMVTTYTQCS